VVQGAAVAVAAAAVAPAPAQALVLLPPLLCAARRRSRMRPSIAALPRPQRADIWDEAGVFLVSRLPAPCFSPLCMWYVNGAGVLVCAL